MKVFLTILFSLGLYQSVLACNVPVFRYALERWQAAPYRLLLIKKGELNADEKKALDHLNTYLDPNSPKWCNLQLFDVKPKELEQAPEIKKIAETFKGSRFILLLPGAYRNNKMIADFPVTKKSVDELVSSPMREAVLKKITSGATATWMLLESGDKAKDDAAEKRLKTALKQAAELIKLPDDVAVAGEDKEVDPINQLQSSVPLKIDFPILRLKKDDKAETLFKTLLMNVENDLHTLKDKPIAIPVFGRGRALYAFVGEGISEDNILEACGYLSGPCSCQVKEQNPGIDLVFAKNWDQLVLEDIIQERELPPLTGSGDLTEDATAAKTDSATAEVVKTDEATPADKKSAVARPETDAAAVEGGKPKMLIVPVVIVVAFLFLAGIAMMRKGGGS
jgi:hypothetical protein